VPPAGSAPSERQAEGRTWPLAARAVPSGQEAQRLGAAAGVKPCPLFRSGAVSPAPGRAKRDAGTEHWVERGHQSPQRSTSACCLRVAHLSSPLSELPAEPPPSGWGARAADAAAVRKAMFSVR